MTAVSNSQNILFGLVEPRFLSLLGGKGCFGHWCQILCGMEPVQDLHRLGKVLGHQVPYPFGAVAQDDQFSGQLGMMVDTRGP